MAEEFAERLLARRQGSLFRTPSTLVHRLSEGLALVWAGGIPLTDPVVKSFVKMGYIDLSPENG